MFALIIRKKLNTNPLARIKEGGHKPRVRIRLTMDLEAKRKTRVAVLQEEIEFIHRANEPYWRQAKPSNAAKAEYYRRQDRLEGVRRELAELQAHK